MKDRQQPPRIEDVNLKSLATGRKREWDARVRPEDVAAQRNRERQKAPWTLYVTVLENGDVLSDKTPDLELIRSVTVSPAVGFVGALRLANGNIQFFTRALKVGTEAQKLLDTAVEALRKQAEDALTNIFRGKHSLHLGDK
jgi:hypothetical protein